MFTGIPPVEEEKEQHRDKSSTPIAEVVEALAEHIKAEVFIRFRELDKYCDHRRGAGVRRCRQHP
jgi:hypothetical protein